MSCSFRVCKPWSSRAAGQRTTRRTLTALLRPGADLLVRLDRGDLLGRSPEEYIAYILRKLTGGMETFTIDRHGAVATQNQSAATRYGFSAIRTEATPGELLSTHAPGRIRHEPTGHSCHRA
jgi:hypothetical protein